MNEYLAEWGRNLKHARRAVGFSSQRDFAAALGVTQQSVSRWEKGACAPRDAQKLAIAELVHQPVRQLFPLIRSERGAA